MKLFETILTAYLNTTNQKKVMVRLMRNILNIKKWWKCINRTIP